MLKGVRKYFLVAVFTFVVLAISALVFRSLAFATSPQSVDYQVNVSPSLVVEVPTGDKVILDLNPNTKTFDSKDMEVVVRTNNVTGYQLFMTTGDNTTDLTRDTSSDTGSPVNAVIPTLTPTSPSSTGYSDSTFSNCTIADCTNKWGYKVTASDVNPSIVTSNYFPFATNMNLATNHLATNGDSTTLKFAAKIDWDQIAGTYENTLVFTAVATYAAYTINYYDGVNNTTGNEIATQTNAYNTSPTVPISPGVTPTRATYSFEGWCDQVPTADVNNYFPATVCPTGHSHQTGDTLTIDPTDYNTDIKLYAYWDPTTFDEAYQIAGKSKPSGSSYYSMQDMATTICADVTNKQTGTLRDTRDTQEYTVAKINGNCWMTRNMAVGCAGSGASYSDNRRSSALTLTNANSNLNTVASWSLSSSSTLSLDKSDATTNCTTASTSDCSSFATSRMKCNSTYGAWYNYVAVSAETIKDASNTNTVHDDICPKQWRLPTNTENRSISTGAATDQNLFNPISGGSYFNGVLNASGGGYWWSTTVYNNAGRYRLHYYDGNFAVNDGDGGRQNGFYVRCIAQ